MPGSAAIGLPVAESSAPPLERDVPDGAPDARAVQASATFAGPLTFDVLLATALVESPDLNQMAARMVQAEADLEAARAAWLPTVGVEASYLRADAPSIFFFKTIDAGRFLPGTDFNDPGAFSNWEAGVGAQFNLYNGGRDALNEGIAGDAIVMAQLDSQAIENALVAAITDGWYSVRASEELMLTAQASIDTVDAQLSEARARFKFGSGLQTDVLSLEVRQAESQEFLLRATNGRDLGLAALAQLAGLENMQDLELVGAGATSDVEFSSLDEALEYALEARPEFTRAQRNVARAKRGVEVSKSSYLPRADAFARGWRDAPELDFDDSRDNWALGLSLSWEAFNGGRKAGVHGARAQLVEAQHGVQKARLGVQFDVSSAWLRVTDARARVDVTVRAAETAEKTLDLVRAQFESGAATITRYLETELMNTRAKMRRTSARYDLERARADLARAVGRYKSATGELR